ncbi:DAK2 domain-containing protein [Saccharothrix sp. AJ9571]|nr:DAK2 domain-containing protein [Saccharothrix sp. AJ9571]
MRELDAAAVGRWASACVHSLDALRPEINGINVYPVADSDTGSNMHHTVSGAWHALNDAPPPESAGEALAVLAKGAVVAAKGNSGVILSQVLRGLAEALAGRTVDGPALAAALGHADEVATGAVARPVAGTMLSVLHAVNAAVSGTTADLGEVTRTAAEAAAEALEHTPQQLPVLARAGVVDAGGRGVVAVLDALLEVVTGTEHAHDHPLTAHSHGHGEPALYAWEVMFLLEDADEAALPVLRKALSGLGDSVTVAADGAGSHAVHVHCADIGAAIEAALDAGRPRRIRVEPLLTPAPLQPGGGLDRTVVVVVRGEGLAEVIRAENVAVLSVPAGSVPSVEEMLGLITETTGNHVTVLAGGPDLTTVADNAAGHAMAGDRDVVVIPCASPVQVLAALAVHDPARRTNDDVVAMAEAAAATRRGEVLFASGEALSVVGRAQAGDVLGLVDGEVVRIEPAAEANLLEAAITVLARLLGPGGELVTVVTGVDAPPDVEEVLTGWLRGEHPEVELVCYSGRQTDAVLLIGVE